MTKRFAPLTECEWTLETRLGFILAACRVRDEQDHELGELLLAAAKDDTIEAWNAVAARANTIGRPDLAVRLRQLVTGKPDADGR
jgi:hypothetical protein